MSASSAACGGYGARRRRRRGHRHTSRPDQKPSKATLRKVQREWMRDDPWHFFETQPIAFLRTLEKRWPNSNAAAQELTIGLLEKKCSCEHVIWRAIRAERLLARDQGFESRFIGFIRSVLIAMDINPLYAHDRRWLRVALDLTPPLQASSSDTLQSLQFGQITVRWQAMVSSDINGEPTNSGATFWLAQQAFNHLSIEPVYRHYGVAPSRSEVLLAQRWFCRNLYTYTAIELCRKTSKDGPTESR